MSPDQITNYLDNSTVEEILIAEKHVAIGNKYEEFIAKRGTFPTFVKFKDYVTGEYRYARHAHRMDKIGMANFVTQMTTKFNADCRERHYSARATTIFNRCCSARIKEVVILDKDFIARIRLDLKYILGIPTYQIVTVKCGDVDYSTKFDLKTVFDNIVEFYPRIKNGTYKLRKCATG